MPALNRDSSFCCRFSTTDSSYDTVGIQRRVNVTCALTSMAEVFTLALSELMQRCLLGWVIPASVDESFSYNSVLSGGLSVRLSVCFG